MRANRWSSSLSVSVLMALASGCLDFDPPAPLKGDAGDVADDATAEPSRDDGGAEASVSLPDAGDSGAGEPQDSSAPTGQIDAGPGDAGSTVPGDAGSTVPADAGSLGDGGVTAAAAGPSLRFHLDEAQWTDASAGVRDSSEFGNHGTVVGTANTVAEGRFGRAGQFDGASWIEVPDAPSLRPSAGLTVSAWFNWTDTGTSRWPGIVSKRMAFQVESAYALFLSPDNHVQVDIAGEDNRFASLGTITRDAWHHVALVFDGTQESATRVRLYIDGALDRSAPESSATIPPYTPTLMLGNLVSGGDLFVGNLDEVALWTRALTESEVAALARSAP
ncbi:MAG: hypothetical protein RL385_803 [Pseudomonadota bacterium]|jgi:hypothetical protein